MRKSPDSRGIIPTTENLDPDSGREILTSENLAPDLGQKISTSENLVQDLGLILPRWGMICWLVKSFKHRALQVCPGKGAGLSGLNYESFRQEPAREYITIFYNKNILLHSSIFYMLRHYFFSPSERRFLLDHPSLLPGRLPTTLQTSRQSLARRLDQVPTMRHSTLR